MANELLNLDYTAYNKIIAGPNEAVKSYFRSFEDSIFEQFCKDNHMFSRRLAVGAEPMLGYSELRIISNKQKSGIRKHV